MKSVLVTGAAGFIGWKTTQTLVEAGIEVVGIDNLNDYYDPRLKAWRLSQLEKLPCFKFVKTDISDKAAIDRLFSANRFDAVINLAARAGVRASVDDPWVYMETNITGVLNLLDAARRHDIQKFVSASTSSAYGNNPIPFLESQRTDEPLSPYAASKKAAEVLCYSYYSLYGTSMTIPRYFTVYGPASRPDMSVFKFIKSIDLGRPITVFGDGSQKRDFTFVDDIAEGTMRCLKVPGYEIINLGNHSPVVLSDVIHMMEDALGKKAVLKHSDRHPADVVATWADTTKAKKLLGWAPNTPIEAGIEAAVKWWRDNQDWAKDLKDA